MNRLENNTTEGFQWSSFILGVISLILAFLAFNNPMVSIVSVTMVFGLGAILKGIYELFIRRRLKQFSGYSSVFLILIGVIDILVGLFFLFNIAGGLVALPIIFSFWIIFDSTGTIITANAIRQYNQSQFWLAIIVGILGVAIGLLLLNNPLSAYIAIATLVGLYFMVNGILNIVYAF